MIIVRFVYILMPLSIAFAFLWAPAALLLGDTSRILYFHVPLAWISVLAFGISGLCSALFLFSKTKRFHYLEVKSHISATLGTLFTILTVITGSVWAHASWGSFWNWDPKETTVMVLMLIYIAYFSLRSSIKDDDKRDRISASYLIIAAATMPFLVFILPRLFDTLHPKEVVLDQRIKITLLLSLVSFTQLFFYLFFLRFKLFLLQKKAEENDNVQ